VSAKLVLIKSAVMKKNESDLSLRNNLDKDILRLKSEFELLKDEAHQARERAEQFEHEVFTDPLTSAMNRRAYDKRIKEEFDRFKRYRRTFSCLLFDVDHFKAINDGYGHATGDICLKEIIKRVTPMLRESDMVSRYGGEEFVVILPETDRKGAGEVAEKLRKTVENIDFVHRENQFKVTISVGVTESLDADKGPADLFQRMDMAMYDAKNSGRNKVVFK
jgi:diguanylate cyclase (GGDEF)-like protein